MTVPIRRDQRQTIAFGIILIAVGAGILGVNVFPHAGAVILLAVGLFLLADGVITRQYAPLVPGGIMAGLGAGVIVGELPGMSDAANGGWVVAGMGLGFLSIWLIARALRLSVQSPWPLIPAAIFLTIGGGLLVAGAASWAAQAWPIVLVVIGLLIVVGALRSRPGGPGPDGG
ncbi:MAG TPA: hypothetical protein VFJ80_01765 [Candidatus Limnocylindrales bacterium]|jgi:hypothetical protein|nr:hypothetical protein [Candidatus Limnocylindrales bacterium]